MCLASHGMIEIMLTQTLTKTFLAWKQNIPGLKLRGSEIGYIRFWNLQLFPYAYSDRLGPDCPSLIQVLYILWVWGELLVSRLITNISSLPSSMYRVGKWNVTRKWIDRLFWQADRRCRAVSSISGLRLLSPPCSSTWLFVVWEISISSLSISIRHPNPSPVAHALYVLTGQLWMRICVHPCNSRRGKENNGKMRSETCQVDIFNLKTRDM